MKKGGVTIYVYVLNIKLLIDDLVATRCPIS